MSELFAIISVEEFEVDWDRFLEVCQDPALRIVDAKVSPTSPSKHLIKVQRITPAPQSAPHVASDDGGPRQPYRDD